MAGLAVVGPRVGWLGRPFLCIDRVYIEWHAPLQSPQHLPEIYMYFPRWICWLDERCYQQAAPYTRHTLRVQLAMPHARQQPSQQSLDLQCEKLHRWRRTWHCAEPESLQAHASSQWHMQMMYSSSTNESSIAAPRCKQRGVAALPQLCSLHPAAHAYVAKTWTAQAQPQQGDQSEFTWRAGASFCACALNGADASYCGDGNRRALIQVRRVGEGVSIIPVSCLLALVSLRGLCTRDRLMPHRGSISSHVQPPSAASTPVHRCKACQGGKAPQRQLPVVRACQLTHSCVKLQAHTATQPMRS